MATLYTHQDSNIRKTWFLLTLFLVLVIGLGFVFGRLYHNPAILYGAIIFSLLMNLVSYWYSDKIALASAGAHPLSREAAPELQRIVENLSITAGLTAPRIYLINDPAPNAFATGRDEHNAAVAVTTGLLNLLDRNELEGVIAHELSHIGNRDILLSTIVVVLVGFISLSADFFLRAHFFGGRDNDRAGALFILLGLLLSVLAPISATLIQLAISRRREFLADASGALLTRYPEGLASALKKISTASRPLARANNATAHLFIANPFGSRARHGVAKLFMTHPPVEERVKALLG